MGKVIDLHAHVVLEESFGTAGEYGPELSDHVKAQEFRVGDYSMRVPYRGSVFMDAEKRIEAMDDLGIDLQVLSPNPLTFFGHIDASNAFSFAKSSNDAMVSHIEAFPERLLGAASIPLQNPDYACEELSRAVTDLGLVAAYIGTDYGFTLDEPRLDDFYQRRGEREVMRGIHIDTKNGIRGALEKRLGWFGLDLIVGYAYEETLAVAALVLGGVLDRHPKLDVCVSHGGGAIAFLTQRIDSMAEFLGNESDFAKGLQLLWFDSHLEAGPAHDLVVSTVGVDRMVFGTNFGGWDVPKEVTDFDRSLSDNAIKLLRLPWTEGKEMRNE